MRVDPERLISALLASHPGLKVCPIQQCKALTPTLTPSPIANHATSSTTTPLPVPMVRGPTTTPLSTSSVATAKKPSSFVPKLRLAKKTQPPSLRSPVPPGPLALVRSRPSLRLRLLPRAAAARTPRQRNPLPSLLTRMMTRARSSPTSRAKTFSRRPKLPSMRTANCPPRERESPRFLLT